MNKYDYDYIIVGSGFGGSVSAMRLSQKGYKVAVIESGKRWKSEDFPKTSFSLAKYIWFPKIFCYGIQRINFKRGRGWWWKLSLCEYSICSAKGFL